MDNQNYDSFSKVLQEEWGGSLPHLADGKHRKIMEQIKNFEDGLGADQEVVLQLAAFGTSMVMAVEEIGYQNPDIMYFYGTVNGRKSQLIQHVSQLNFLILSAQKVDPAKKTRRIGFVPPGEG